MNIDGKAYRTIWRVEGGVEIIDQTRLPHELAIVALRSVADVAQAIRDMQVRGAPLIGGTAAYGMAIAAAADSSDAALAAARHTAADLRCIREANDACDDAANKGRLGKEEDLEFHMAIAHASGNALFAETMELLHDDIQDGMDTARNLSKGEQKERVRILRDEHGAVLEALADNDADRARVAMRAHLHNAQRRIVGAK